jgi:hypothetical protein
MPKYFDLTKIAQEAPDLDCEGDPPGSSENATVFARLMLAELDKGPGKFTDPDGRGRFTDVEHVVDTFNDALAGLLLGLSVRVAPGQMKDVVAHLVKHASYTMQWIARDENNSTDADKEELEEIFASSH